MKHKREANRAKREIVLRLKTDEIAAVAQRDPQRFLEGIRHLVMGLGMITGARVGSPRIIPRVPQRRKRPPTRK